MEHSVKSADYPAECFRQAEQLYAVNREALEEYISQLKWWNRRVNLVSRNVPRETIRMHVRHSLLLSTLPEYSQAFNIVDAGTGGGLPGLPLSIVSPGKEFLLNDIVSKKIMAVKQMALKAGITNVSVFGGPVEKCPVSEGALLISKHAFKINELYEMAGGKKWGAIIMMKGYEEVPNELEGIKQALHLDIHKLDKSPDNEFYKGKALVVIKRK